MADARTNPPVPHYDFSNAARAYLVRLLFDVASSRMDPSKFTQEQTVSFTVEDREAGW